MRLLLPFAISPRAQREPHSGLGWNRAERLTFTWMRLENRDSLILCDIYNKSLRKENVKSSNSRTTLCNYAACIPISERRTSLRVKVDEEGLLSRRTNVWFRAQFVDFRGWEDIENEFCFARFKREIVKVPRTLGILYWAATLIPASWCGKSQEGGTPSEAGERRGCERGGACRLRRIDSSKGCGRGARCLTALPTRIKWHSDEVYCIKYWALLARYAYYRIVLYLFT
jgi:hypothetical protein